ncbi:50S ribosomal protein L11 methyltransferase [Ruminococcus flavefaciens]|uniref:Ribosomal protein L11 methyltransferase n=1 Tax=Ruminococcus flavefaciens 007c TaxID=1341157 RepID=W7UY63_RUMFL|nr:50S ribosomal protein L11 methyltransferase [Ruminococcus flavefaciens]EWM53590.1 50S ribosomal protein L12 [Ruminococcus flavefaciens 007c]
MEWTEVNIYTTTQGIELLCSKLTDIGIKGFSIKDSEDFKEFLENKNGQWDYIDDDLMGLSECETCITVYIPSNGQGAEMLLAIKSMLAEMKNADTENIYGRLEAEMTSIREEDWANNWKQYFKPFKVGEKLVIKPSWEEYDNSDGRIILEIDPASSFGTGKHHTTRLCLEVLEKYLKKGDKLLDMGCGSGILSIGAMLLGAGSAIAVDIEENAAVTARENAVKNNIPTDLYRTYFGNILTDEKLADEIDDRYDMIMANIVADVLISMKECFLRYLKKGGVLIVSGIIEERMDEVIDALKSVGFKDPEPEVREGWAAVKLTV